MSTFKKIIIIISISLNLVFLLLFAALIAKFVYWEGKPFFDRQPPFSWFYNAHMNGRNNMRHKNHFKDKGNSFLKNGKNNYRNGDSHYGDEDDEDDEDDDYEDYEDSRMGQKMARNLARNIFVKPGIKDNLKRLSQIHEELILVSQDENYDEEKIQKLFDDFSEVFLDTKKVVEKELLYHMRGMPSHERASLIKGFLRSRFY